MRKMQIYDEKCRVYTSVRDVMPKESFPASLRSPVDVHLRYFRERNKSSGSAMSAMECKCMSGKKQKCFMQIRQENYEEEKKCENVLIQHECFSLWKSRNCNVIVWHAGTYTRFVIKILKSWHGKQASSIDSPTIIIENAYYWWVPSNENEKIKNNFPLESRLMVSSEGELYEMHLIIVYNLFGETKHLFTQWEIFLISPPDRRKIYLKPT